MIQMMIYYDQLHERILATSIMVNIGGHFLTSSQNQSLTTVLLCKSACESNGIRSATIQDAIHDAVRQQYTALIQVVL